MFKLFLILIVCANIGNIYAQGDYEVDLDNPDLALLERQTFDAINGLRFDKKISPLAWDDILYRAARDHADYLIKEKKLSHEQRTKSKSTPGNRVKLHSGLGYNPVGENLVSVTLGVVHNLKGRKLSTQSIISTANTMAQLWKASPHHYGNILEKRFNASALAVAYEPTSQRVVAVQVFAFTREPVNAAQRPDRSEELLNMAERKLPFGLKESGEFSKQRLRSIQAFMKLEIINGKLVGSYKLGKRAFKGRRSGVAVESIPLTQFDSGAIDYDRVRNRRNGLYALNGVLQKPVYRHEMLKYARRHSPKRLWINLGIFKIHRRKKIFIYPVDAAPGTNLFLICKKQLTTYVTPIGLPARLLDEPLPSLKLVSSITDVPARQNFEKITKYDTMMLKVFYPSRVVTPDSLTTQKIIAALEKLRGTVVSVSAAAYASIDGEMSENQALAKQRINTFMALIKPYLDTINIEPQLVSKEQWELFSRQIEAHHLLQLKKLHKRDLRTYVNTHKDDSLISRLLAEQRFTLFKMVIRHDSLIPLPPERAVEDYYRQKNKFEALEVKTASQAAILEKAQLKAYGEIIAKNSEETLEVIDSERYPAFKYHDLIFHCLIRHDLTDQQLYRKLHELAQLKYLPVQIRKQLLFNNLVLIYKNYNIPTDLDSMMDIDKLYCTRYRKSEFLLRHYKRNRCRRNERLFSDQYYILKEFPQLISLERSQISNRFHKDSLSKFYTVSMIQALYEPAFPKEIFTHLANVKSLFHPDDRALSLNERVRLASFYCAMNKEDVAKSLLLPVMEDPNLDPEGRKLFITLQYDAYPTQHEFIDYLIGQFSSLGKQEWCGIWTEGIYLSHLLLEDTKLKKFYNCQCQPDSKDH